MMEVVVADKAGFCFGVKRAVEIAERTITGADQRVSTLGPLIHNPTVVHSLEARGVRAADSPADAGSGILIVRSHGAPPSTIDAARDLGLRVVDATCPFVRKAQSLARRLADAGYQVVVVGDPGHPEITAVSASAGRSTVVASAADLDHIRLRARVGVVCQTTLTPEVLAEVTGRIATSCRELLVYNTICTATFERQRAAMDLARTVEAMVVVGGRQSANTAHLAEVCRRIVPTRLVESADDLKQSWFAGCRRVGITAGASTPAEQIAAVKEQLQQFSQEGTE